MVARFLNADLDIHSAQPLHTLRDEIGQWAFNLYCGEAPSGYLTVFEIDQQPADENPELLITRFCDLIETLGPQSLALWANASRRVVNLGFEVDEAAGHRMETNVSAQTLGRMAALNMEMAFTIYQSDHPNT